jgi:NitT/TauT family transport system permease protein
MTASAAALDRASRRRTRIVRATRSYGLSIGIILVFFVLWEFVLPGDVSRVLPRPSVIVSRIWSSRSTLLRAVQYTALEAVLGFLLGNGVAVLLAVSFIYSPTAADTVYPMAVVLRSIPLVALTPFIIIFFGQGIAGKVVIAALICFFPTLVNMVQGLTSVDVQALELMHTLNASERNLFWKMRVPYSLPYLFTSFKITSSAAVLGAIIGEWVGASKGLGAVIVSAMFNAQTELLWAAMIVATVVSILAYGITALAERILIPWHESVKQAQVGE